MDSQDWSDPLFVHSSILKTNKNFDGVDIFRLQFSLIKLWKVTSKELSIDLTMFWIGYGIYSREQSARVYIP